jgi:hypothetical protein
MQSSDEDIGLEIEAIFKRHRRRYCYRRIRGQLVDQCRSVRATANKRILPLATTRKSQVDPAIILLPA